MTDRSVGKGMPLNGTYGGDALNNRRGPFQIRINLDLPSEEHRIPNAKKEDWLS